MGSFLRQLVVCGLVCLLCSQTAIAALPEVSRKEIADFLRVLSEPDLLRDMEFERRLVTVLTAKPDLDAASGELATAFALTPAQARRLGELWVLFVLYEKNVFFSYDPKVTREESDRREKIFKAELRGALMAFVRATKHAPVAVTAASKAMSAYVYSCEPADFDAIVKGADAAVEWLAAREADCTEFWLAINARRKMHPAVLLRIAEYGILSRAQRIAVVEHLRRQVPSLSATARQAVDGYLARTLAYDYWDAGLVDSGLQLYEGLPIDLQRYVRSDEVPETVTFGGFSRTLDQKRAEFPRAETHQFHEQLAGALLVRNRANDARKALAESAAFGAAARATLTCALAEHGDCERLESRSLRWLYLDLVLNRPREDPYDLFERSHVGFTGWGESGLWLEVLRATVRDANYRTLEERGREFWDPEDSSYRREEWEAINATFDTEVRARITELNLAFDERRRAMGSKPVATWKRRASRIAPVSAYFPEAKMPACKGPATEATTIAPEALGAGFAPVRAERRGNVVAVVSLSQNYDPSGEVSGGGYWVHLSPDSGKTWESPRYTGLAQFFPYEVQALSCLPLIADDRLQVEVAVKEIDTASITYPPVGMRLRREQKGLYLDIPFATLKRDTDGDGLTDIAEENLLLDAGNADSDGDGLADGRDPFPNVRFSRQRRPIDSAMTEVIGQLSERGFGAIIEPVDRQPDDIMAGGQQVQALSLDRPLFIRGQKADFGGFSATKMTLIYGDDEVVQIEQRKADFNATWFGPLILNRAGTRGFISWSAGWVGGMFRVVKLGDKWRAEEISSWIT